MTRKCEVEYAINTCLWRKGYPWQGLDTFEGWGLDPMTALVFQKGYEHMGGSEWYAGLSASNIKLSPMSP